jgi:uncharacterized protein YneF (UPF0154 family)
MVGVWIWHIAAGLIGVLLSLSIVYKVLEARWNPHQPIDPAQVQTMTDATGNTKGPAEVRSWLQRFHQMAYLGRTEPWHVPARAPDVCIRLSSGARVEVFCDGPMWVVVRRTPRGRAVAYRLYETVNA